MTANDPEGDGEAMAAGRRPPAAERSGDADASTGDAARFADLLRGPRIAALGGAFTALGTLAVNLFVLEDMSGLLFVVTASGAVVFLLTFSNVVGFSPRAVERLRQLSEELGGRFRLWKAGTGGHGANPFASGVEHQRFGVVTGALHGMPIEIGHMSSHLTSQYRAPGGRRYGYVVIRLPERLPHMVVSFGHLSGFYGVRLIPNEWHRSQLLDIGARRFRPFVVDGGEVVARAFFRPELVALFERVGRDYDIEIRNRSLYLLAHRSPAAGSERRWVARRRLVEEVAATLATSDVWESVRRLNRRLRDDRLRMDVRRTGFIIFGAGGVAVVVLSLAVLWAAGYIG